MNLLEGVFSGLVDGCWEVTSPSPLLCKCVCVCVCVCVLRASFSQLSCLLPSRSSSLALSVGRSVVQIQGFASGRSGLGPPLTRAHPYSHSRAGNAHAQSLSAGAPRFRGIPSMLRGFSKSPRQGNKERSFSNHFPEIFSFNFPSKPPRLQP